MANPNWHKLLQPWAAHYCSLVVAIRQHVESLTPDELAALDDATRRPTQTNCAWDEYGVASLIRDEIKRVQYRRAQHRPVGSVQGSGKENGRG